MSLESWYLRRASRRVVHLIVAIKRQSPYSGIAWREYTALCNVKPGTSYDWVSADEEPEVAFDWVSAKEGAVTCYWCTDRQRFLKIIGGKP